MNRLLLVIVLVVFSWLLLAQPAWAYYGDWFSGAVTRSRAIQVCVVVMALGLFIMMKKLAER